MSLSDEEKIRLLEKRIQRLEDVIAKGGRPQYLFCPSLNCWLPAQCDPEGRQVIDPSDLDTRYELANTCLKIDGSRGIQSEKKLFWNFGAGRCYIDNYAPLTSTYGENLRFYAFGYVTFQGANVYFYGGSMVFASDYVTFQSPTTKLRAAYGFPIELYKSGAGAGYVNAMRFYGNIASPYVDVPLCGDITFVAGKRLTNVGDVSAIVHKNSAGVLKFLSGLRDDISVDDYVLYSYGGDVYVAGANVRIEADKTFMVGASAGVSGSFTTVDGKTVTVTKGLITSIV